VLALVPQADAAAPCPIERLPDETLRTGDDAVERYQGLRRLQFTPDLMGYRDGPALGPASPRERRAIRHALRFRRLFGLNQSRLLVRRLLRDRSPAVRRSAADLGTPLTALEQRDFDFRIRLQNGTASVRRYVDLCARRVSGGIHLDQDDPDGIHIVVSVVAGRGRHLEALRARYRFRALLRVRRVRFTERRLNSVMDRITGDLDELRRIGVHVRSVTLLIVQNRVAVTLRDGSRRDRRLLRRGYGPVVRIGLPNY
jgi:hypothetical protein